MNRFTRRRALVLLVLTCVLFITIDQRDNSAVSGARTAFSYVFRPFKGMARAATRPVRNAWRGMTHYGQLEKENLALRDELARQAGNAAAAQAFVQEHNELLSLEQLPISPNIPTVKGHVIGGSPRDDQQTVEIDVGSRRGIRIGMPVVNGAGLIGKITEVYPDGAVVRLITDTQYVLAVRIACAATVPGTVDATVSTTPTGIPVGGTDPRFTTPPTSTTLVGDTVPDSSATTSTSAPTTSTTPATTGTTVPGETTAPSTSVAGPTTTVEPCDRETGSIRGRGKSDRPIIGLLSDDVRSRDISIGDQVITAGGAESLAPPNLPVGHVARVIDRKGDSPEVEVDLNADFSQLNFVEVLLYVPASEVNP